MKCFKLALLVVVSGAFGLSDAAVLRWAAKGDVQTLDPHASVEGQTTNVVRLIYEPLVEVDSDSKVRPCLAVKWLSTTPGVWRLILRDGVSFHDGTPFTARDVVYSVLRAQAPSSRVSSAASLLGTVREINGNTVEFRQERPHPLFFETLSGIRIMSAQWTELHGGQRVPQTNSGAEASTSRDAMGTGPFRLVQRLPGVSVELRRNAAWWATQNERKSALDGVLFLPISNDFARAAALLSGNVDFVQDVPPSLVSRLRADRRLSVSSQPENRVIFIGFDQRPESTAFPALSNPFADRRVRQAVSLAIDVPMIANRVLAGFATPTGCLTISAKGCPSPSLDAAPEHDLERARSLLKAAGFEAGFNVAMDCPNDRYLNDSMVCVAIAGMLGKVGIRIEVNAQSKNIHFPRVQKGQSAFFLYGWGGGFPDAQPLMNSVLHSRFAGKGGDNGGNVSDPALDAWIDLAESELDIQRRRHYVKLVLERQGRNFYYLPLYRQRFIWAHGLAIERASFDGSGPRLEEFSIR